MLTISVADAYALIEGIPPGEWVAVSMDRNVVVASGQEALAVMQAAKDKGEPQPLMIKVPEPASAMFL